MLSKQIGHNQVLLSAQQIKSNQIRPRTSVNFCGIERVPGDLVQITSDAARATLRRVENEIKDLPEEVAVIIDPVTGNEISRTQGDAHHVVLGKAKSIMEGNILTHNHPASLVTKALSPGDLATAIQEGLAEIRAVCIDEVHSVKLPRGFSVDSIPQSIIKESKEVLDKITGRKPGILERIGLRRPKLNLEKFIKDYIGLSIAIQVKITGNDITDKAFLNKAYNDAFEKLCKKLGLSYSCEKLN